MSGYDNSEVLEYQRKQQVKKENEVARKKHLDDIEILNQNRKESPNEKRS